MPVKYETFVLDVDGVLTTGQFLYTSDGKAMKVFGPDDNDGLSLLRDHLNIIFVTGDKRGFAITRKRVQEDMGYPLELVSTIRRIDWIEKHFNRLATIYMGDGIFDHYVMRAVGYSIAPANSHPFALGAASYVTRARGGERAVAEACLHLLEKFYTPFSPDRLPEVKSKLSGTWDVREETC